MGLIFLDFLLDPQPPVFGVREAYYSAFFPLSESSLEIDIGTR